LIESTKFNQCYRRTANLLVKLALIAARSSKQKQTDQFPIGDKNYN